MTAAVGGVVTAGTASAALGEVAGEAVAAASRGVGVMEVLSALPPTVVAVFAALTQLGDAWFVFAFGALVYWRRPSLATAPRRAGALVVATGLLALGLSTGLKSLFAMARPPGAGTATPPGWLPTAIAGVYENAATGDGFGFPSGHAIAATAVYGTLAAVLDEFDRRRRLAAAAALVVTISASRLVLGVHYLVDVVAGVGAGLAGVALLLWTTGYEAADGAPSRSLRPTRAFAVVAGVLVAAFAVAAAGGHAEEAFEAVVGLGAALGAALAWRVAGDEATTRPAVSWPAAAVGLVVTGAAWAGAYALASSLVVGFLGSVVAVGGVVAYPALTGRATERSGA
ncbi:MAG: phosphatase PAP2 family protein [Halolamina sp.]